MKLCNQFISRPFRLPALLMGVSLSLTGCSMQTDGDSQGKTAMLLDSDVKSASHALVRMQETPSFLAPGQKRPAAMLLDIDSGGAKSEKSTPFTMQELKPAAVR